MITLRELQIAKNIQSNSARPEDLQELATLILCKCHHPQSEIKLREFDATNGEAYCGLCGRNSFTYDEKSLATLRAIHALLCAPTEKAQNND